MVNLFDLSIRSGELQAGKLATEPDTYATQQFANNDAIGLGFVPPMLDRTIYDEVRPA